MHVNIEPHWKEILGPYFSDPSFIQLTNFVSEEYLNNTIYPKPQDVFRAFHLTPFDQVQVVILGQDPYHNPGQAEGLCFSVPDGIKPPPSLVNIYKEIESDLGMSKDRSQGNLVSWAEQGVLLLNSVLTVHAHQAASHAGHGWEEFTDYVITQLSEQREHLVFLLWGNYAKKKGAHINRNKHLVLESAHPSPLAARHGFFGNKHFSQTNEYLKEHGRRAIDW